MGIRNKISKSKIINLILIITIFILIFMIIYIAIVQKPKPFTEFYILGPDGKAANYPHYLKKGEPASVIIGIVNHEYKIMNYTLTIWLVNETWKGNNTIVIHHIYLLKQVHVRLKPIPIKAGYIVQTSNWSPEWQRLYTFSINKTGKFKIFFILFKRNITIPPSTDYANNTKVKEWILDASNVSTKTLSLNLNILVR